MKKITILFFIFISVCALAQTPQKINYQGVARDNTGAVIPNQSIGLRISLHSGSTSGTIVYQESHSASTNAFGLFNLEIGTGSVVSGTFNTISWGTNTYYIQVEMDATGGTSYSNMGTSQLVSVPYALYAEEAGNANTYSAGTGIAINNNIITNTAPDTDDQTLSVSGNTLSINGGNSVTIPSYWTANGNHIYNNNSSNVGIGTTSPISKLMLEHSASSGDGRYILRLNNPSTGSGSLAGIILDAGSSSDNDGNLFLEMLSETYQTVSGYEDFAQIRGSGGGLVLRASDAIGSGNEPVIRFQTQTIPPANGAYDRMIITHDGDIGIGTTTPQTQLPLSNGDFYLDNSANGVIIKSPNNSCWKITVDNTGALTTISVTCP